jgi:16S rRNA (guanine(527)-N(7))-methyltransferase RsmG
MHTHNADDITRIVESIPDVHQRLDVNLLRIFLEELLAWNPQLGLVSKRDTPSVTVNVIHRCVEMWELIGKHAKDSSRDEPRNVADIGSGAGFPGLIWKLMAPGLRVTLIERKSRRAFFLERVVGLLGLQDVRILASDLRELVREPAAREVFDLAVMLAVAPPERIGNDAERLLEPGGYLVTTQAGTDPAAAVVGSSLHLAVETPLSNGVFLLYQKHSR